MARVAVTALLIGVVVGGGACSGKATTTRVDAAPVEHGDPALREYMRGLRPLIAMEAEALAAIEAQTGAGYKDDATFAAALRASAIPRYREFVDGLRKLPRPPEPRGALHDKLCVLAGAELATIEQLADALERGDGAAVIAVNAEQRRLADEMDALVSAWQRP